MGADARIYALDSRKSMDFDRLYNLEPGLDVFSSQHPVFDAWQRISSMERFTYQFAMEYLGLILESHALSGHQRRSYWAANVSWFVRGFTPAELFMVVPVGREDECGEIVSVGFVNVGPRPVPKWELW